MAYTRKQLIEILEITDEDFRGWRRLGIIPDSQEKAQVGSALRDIWTEAQLKEIIANINKVKRQIAQRESKKISASNINEIAQAFMSYGEENPIHLWYFLGMNSSPGLKIRPVGARNAVEGIEFCIAVEGSQTKVKKIIQRAGKGRSSHVVLLDPNTKCNAPVIEGATLFSATVDKKYVNEVLEGLASGYAEFFSPKYFARMKEVFPWESAEMQSPQMHEKVSRYKSRAETELRKQSQLAPEKRNQDKIARNERILVTIEDYFRRPIDRQSFDSYRKKPPTYSKKTYRMRMPPTKRFPEGWRPVIARSESECEMLTQLSRLAGCEFPCVETPQGKKNPVKPAEQGKLEVNGKEFDYYLDVIPLPQAITSHDDELKPSRKFPAAFRPRNFNNREVQKQLEGLTKILSPELMAIPGPYSTGAPVAFGDCILDGNLRVIALRASPQRIKSKYFDYVQQIMGIRGLLVRQLIGNEKQAVEFVKSIRKTAPVKNPILMVGNPKKNRAAQVEKVGWWESLFGRGEAIDLAPEKGRSKKGRPPEIRYKKKGKEKIPVYPKDENGFPLGAVPLSQIPASVKNHPSFKKSWKMFKDRYKGDPDFAMPVLAAKGVPKVLAGIGQLKQLDYWAADNVSEAGDWIHWYHEAGERGENKAWTRPCIVAADPYTGRVLLVEPEGSDVKFTNRGIVG